LRLIRLSIAPSRRSRSRCRSPEDPSEEEDLFDVDSEDSGADGSDSGYGQKPIGKDYNGCKFTSNLPPRD